MEKNEKVSFLQNLCYQHGDFFICANYGEGRYSKWKSILWCWENLDKERWRIEAATDRTICRNEVVLDLDPEKDEKKDFFEERVIRNIFRLRRRIIHTLRIYFSGGNGYHIHLIINDLGIIDDKNLQACKRRIIEHFGAEGLKASDRHMILIEGEPNRKTRKPKTEVFLF